ncbi:MAG: hypothetical protein IJV03_00905 [Alphaproteobacteria bacterium]|nr:hypothetical protein [Alphaproteobacteria bacterium]
MKKSLLLVPVLALAACGNSIDIDVAQHDARFAEWKCERIVSDEQHLVYKCPSDLEWIVNVKKQEPNALFQSGSNLNWDEINADTEHTYVEVVPSEPETDCKENFHYRTMVKPISKEFYAVIGCK